MEDADRRYNTFVDFVNANRAKEELVPPIQNEEENKLFDNMVKELTEMRKKNPSQQNHNLLIIVQNYSNLIWKHH